MLTPEELRQYQRQLALREVGMAGQRKLKRASVLIMGAGGLGSPLALYLAAAGVGRLGVMDFDRVEPSNLHRQVLHTTKDLGRPKAESARATLQDLNPHITIEALPVRLCRQNALEVIARFDVVADGTDNFATRYLINDACVLTGTPNVHGSVYQFEGQLSVFCTPSAPCYRCLFPAPPPPDLVPSCAEGGVLGILPGIIGSLQATEVIKLVLGIGSPLIGRVLMVDALGAAFQTLTVRRSSACALCGDAPTITGLVDYAAFCGTDDTDTPEIAPRALHRMRGQVPCPLLLDVRHEFEADIDSIGADLVIPLPQLGLRLSELEQYRNSRIVVHCRSGVRSRKAVRMLRNAGFAAAVSLAGGILAWRRDVDPAV